MLVLEYGSVNILQCYNMTAVEFYCVRICKITIRTSTTESIITERPLGYTVQYAHRKLYVSIN